MPNAYTEDQLVEQPAIGLFAELGWLVAAAAGGDVGGVGDCTSTSASATKGFQWMRPFHPPVK